MSPFYGKNYAAILKKNKKCKVDFSPVQSVLSSGTNPNILEAMMHRNPDFRASIREIKLGLFFQNAEFMIQSEESKEEVAIKHSSFGVLGMFGFGEKKKESSQVPSGGSMDIGRKISKWQGSQADQLNKFVALQQLRALLKKTYKPKEKKVLLPADSLVVYLLTTTQ